MCVLKNLCEISKGIFERGFALEIWNVDESADMVFRPYFEGRELSNQCAKPVTWRVKMTPRHKQTWLTHGITFKVRVTTTCISDSKCIIDDQKLGRNLDDDKAKFFGGNLDGQNEHRPQLPFSR